MKKLVSICLVLILLIIPISTSGLEISVFNKEKNIKKNNLDINPITPKNDAYHGKKNFLTVENWYFDAIFDNNYSAQVGIKVCTFRTFGFLEEVVNIYNNSKVYKNINVKKPLRYFQISEKFPDIKYNDKSLMKFDYNEYNKTGNWNYSINIDVEKIKLDLSFIGKSEGFTYITSREGWTVAQPKANVFGTIKIDENEIQVTGIGYHDHNWNFSLRTTIRATGWFWGKIMSKNYSLTWSKIKKTIFGDDTIAENIGILSIVNNGNIGINPDNISFTASNYKFHSARFIPTDFSFYAKQENLEINIRFTPLYIQHTDPDFLTINYWRYFISINGYIRVGENIDYLDNDIQIMEHIRFI